jgi:hypothetical protein
MSETKKIGSLTERQRRALSAMLGGGGTIESERSDDDRLAYGNLAWPGI